MYFLGIYFDNARKNGTGKYCFRRYKNRIAKWTRLSSGPPGLELLQLIALACGGSGFLAHLPGDLQDFLRTSDTTLQLESVLAPHFPVDSKYSLPSLFGAGIRIDESGQVKNIKPQDYCFLPSELPKRKMAVGTGNTPYFCVGYGSELKPRQQTDNFDFSDPFFRITRFYSLFDKHSPITDPVAFLTRLNTKAIRFVRFPAKHSLPILCRLFKEYLSIDTKCWMDKRVDFAKEWSRLRSWQQRAALPILDAVRHLIDAFPRSGKPLSMTGLMLIDRPDHLCTEKIFPKWVTLLDRLMPQMQFVLTLSEQSWSAFPSVVKKKRLLLPEFMVLAKKKETVRMSRGAILLIDVDSRLPNLALMKLGRFFKEQGEQVILRKKDPLVRGAKGVYASCVFYSHASREKIKRLKAFYGESLTLGGSGVDIHRRLPVEIEKLPADYSLYPELEDRAIGFITRGCPGKCPFCIVPAKEGKPHQVSDLDMLLENDRKKLILLDDNILSHPRAGDFLEEMVSRELKVNFNQTIDIRLVDREKANLLRRIGCSNTRFSRRNYHFSLNDTRNLNRIGRIYRMFDFAPSDNVEFICMYAYNTTLGEDVERFRFLRSLPGAYVFVQKYQPIPGGVPPNLYNFFDDRADELIDELVGLLFPQNMKSMEKYYRWLSRFYVETFSKLHDGLVDTLFKYNYRDRKGRYIATLAETLP